MKTKHKSFVECQEGGHCFAAIAIIAETDIKGKTGFRIYTAWEWKTPAQTQFFGFFKSDGLYSTVPTPKEIMGAADRGWRLTNDKQAKKIFPYLFIQEQQTNSYPQD